MDRFMIAAAHKSSGKTVLSTGISAVFAAAGGGIQTFKKGPDYIDPMWLSLASGRPSYNLDFNTMRASDIGAFFARRSGPLNLIEANKGLYDGVSLDGSDSNAQLAKLLTAPVVLVIDTMGLTRGIAPLLLGYQVFDPDVRIAGVILNKVGGSRHEAKLRAAVEAYTDIPVVGAVTRNPGLEIGERHLGLTTPAELGEVQAMIGRFADAVKAGVDIGKLREIAAAAPDPGFPVEAEKPRRRPDVRIGVARDQAFGFYYPDDLEAFADAGAELVFFNTLADTRLPDVDGLFIGGGFPETQAAGLAANTAMRAAIQRAVSAGMPVYAECGGLMYLCRSLSWQGETFPMVGSVPGDAVMHVRPQGRGYARYECSGENNLWETCKSTVQAHEFHYATVDNLPDDTRFSRRIVRGAGVNGRADGIVINNLVAGFVHLRSTPEHCWVRDFVDFVRRKKAC